MCIFAINLNAMKFKYLLAVLASALISSSLLQAQASPDTTTIEGYLAAHQIEAETIEDGFYYQIDAVGRGNVPQTGDYVMVRYVGKLLDGTVFDRSEPGDPFVFQMGYRQVIRAWEKGITFFPVGSKGQLFVPPHLGYGQSGVGRTIPPNSPLIFELEVMRIMDFEAYDRYMEELERKEREAFIAAQNQQFADDKKMIHEYAAANRLKTKRLPSGMSYAIKKKGKGSLPQEGDKMTVEYEGFLLDGTPFDSSKGKSFSFELGKGKVIPGWDEGLRYFRKGSSGWLLIPSKMAYGPRSIEEEGISIPANAVLIFKIKVKNIEAD